MSKRGHAESGLDTTAERPKKRAPGPGAFPFLFPDTTSEATTSIDTCTTPPKRSRSELEDLNEDERPAKRVALTPAISISSLPNEILEAILEIGLPPANLFQTNPAPKYQPLNDVWRVSMTFRRDVVAVCKLWRELGLRFLYREIVLIDRYMLRALLRTLEAEPALCQLVRAIHLRMNRKGCEANNYDETINKNLDRVLVLCPNLTRFVHAPPIEQSGLRSPLPSLGPNLTVLNIGAYRIISEPLLDFQWVPDALQRTCGTLEELWITAADLEQLQKMSLSFPQLHTLYLHCWGYSKQFASKWKMPNLTKLTFLPLDRHALEEHASLTPLFNEYTRILQQHGANLTSLVFPPRYPGHDGEDEETHATLLSLCPLLTHVILPALEFPNVALTRALPNVRALDIWCADHWGGTPSKRAVARLIARVFPNLERRPRLLDPMLTRVLLDAPVAMRLLDDSCRPLPRAEVIAALAADDAPESDDEEVEQEELPGFLWSQGEDPHGRGVERSRRVFPADGDVTPRGLRYPGFAMRAREFGEGLGVYYRPVFPTDEDLEEERMSNRVGCVEEALVVEYEEEGKEHEYGVEEKLDLEEEDGVESVASDATGLRFRPRLRRVLKAVLPPTLFYRLERAVEELLEDAQP